MARESEILAEAERGEVVCRLYRGYGEADPAGQARDAQCRALCDQGRLRFHGWSGQRTAPDGLVSKWIKP